jgi:hypothetical protein
MRAREPFVGNLGLQYLRRLLLTLGPEKLHQLLTRMKEGPIIKKSK